MTRPTILYGALIAALLGALDAGYLSFVALAGDPLTCNFIEGCQVVATSPYSKILGIPLSLFGFFFYIVAAGLIVWLLQSPSKLAEKLLIAAAALGLLASTYFTYLQAVVIKAWCEYCVFSAAMTVLLFILVVWYIVKENKKEEKLSL